jgi:hypothetical protein
MCIYKYNDDAHASISYHVLKNSKN